MGWTRKQTEEALTVREAFEKLTLDDLRPLAGLVSTDPPKRKSELAPLLAKVMTNAARVRDLYAGLDASAQRAVRVAAFDPAGRLEREKFRAWFGEEPRFDTSDPNRASWEHRYEERRQIKPLPLRLFFPRFDHLPTDTRAILREFVPPPEPFAVSTRDAPPETHTLHEHVWHDKKRKLEEWEEPVRVRETAAAAGADVRTVLRLIEAGKVRVTDKKLFPTEAARQAVAGVLAGGDFYAPDDDRRGGGPADRVCRRARGGRTGGGPAVEGEVPAGRGPVRRGPRGRPRRRAEGGPQARIRVADSG